MVIVTVKPVSRPLRHGVVDLHVLDARARRSVADRALEPFDRLGLAFGGRLDAAVGQVAHPAVQPSRAAAAWAK